VANLELDCHIAGKANTGSKVALTLILRGHQRLTAESAAVTAGFFAAIAVDQSIGETSDLTQAINHIVCCNGGQHFLKLVDVVKLTFEQVG
jgi:hypothetical protein